MFRTSAVVARQREVNHVSMDALVSPTVLSTFGGATVEWQPTIGRTVLSIDTARGC
jgi:hypothetical protein